MSESDHSDSGVSHGHESCPGRVRGPAALPSYGGFRRPGRRGAGRHSGLARVRPGLDDRAAWAAASVTVISETPAV